MSKRYGVGAFCVALVLLLSFAVQHSADAAITGKVTGVVRDAATGEVLPGANVVIQGFRRGATTDADGHFLILAVEPGEYTLEASMVGYGKASQSEVRVIADYTTTVDFSLKEGSLELSELVVVAERPSVEPDKTTSKHVMTALDIESVPMVRSSTELISLQPGMALDGSDRIRGSENTGNSASNPVGYYVDGIQMNRTGFSNVNTSAIQEVSVLTGGMNAEFGNALAGVVTVVTKDGAREFGGKGEYRFTPKGKRHWGENLYENPVHKDKMKWNDPDWVNEKDPVTGDLIHVKSDYTEHMGHRVEGNLSGPIASNLSFFVSSTYSKTASRLPSASPTSPFNTRNVGNVTFRPSENIKLKLGGLLDRSDPYYIPDSNWEGAVKGMNGGTTGSGRNIFLPEGFSASGKQKRTESLLYATLTHSLGTKTYYDLRVYSVSERRDPFDVPTTTGAIRTDAAGWFYLPRDIVAYDDYSNKRIGLKLDYTSQVSRSHLLQAGFELRRHDYWFTNYREDEPGNRVLRFVGKDYELGQGVNPWDFSGYVQDKLEYGGLIVNAGLRYDYFNYGRPWRQSVGIEISPMYTKYNYRQYENDHMESGSPTFTSLSPRVGISHPITSELAAHYFIGRFHTNPQMNELFQMSYASKDPDRDVNGNGTIDDTEKWNALDALTSFGMGGGRHATEGVHSSASTNVEMGVDWNFVADYTASITAFYRLDEGIYGTNNIVYWQGPKLTTSQIGVVRNAYWSSSRGLEVSLRKSFSNNFSFRVGYNLEWQHGLGYGGSRPHYGNYESNWYVIPDGDFIASEHYWYAYAGQSDGTETPVPLTADEKVSLGNKANEILATWEARTGTAYAEGVYSAPLKVNEKGLWVVATSVGGNPAPRNINRQNQLSVQFLYATPTDYGPQLLGMRPFGGLRVSSVYRMISGTPFEYTPPVGPSEWKKQSPAMRTDVNIQKNFQPIGGLRPSLFAEITNLFNEKNSDEATYQYVQYGLKEPAPDNPDFLTYGDTGEWNRYRWDPRLIQAGLMLEF